MQNALSLVIYFVTNHNHGSKWRGACDKESSTLVTSKQQLQEVKIGTGHGSLDSLFHPWTVSLVFGLNLIQLLDVAEVAGENGNHCRGNLAVLLSSIGLWGVEGWVHGGLPHEVCSLECRFLGENLPLPS